MHCATCSQPGSLVLKTLLHTVLLGCTWAAAGYQEGAAAGYEWGALCGTVSTLCALARKEGSLQQHARLVALQAQMDSWKPQQAFEAMVGGEREGALNCSSRTRDDGVLGQQQANTALETLPADIEDWVADKSAARKLARLIANVRHELDTLGYGEQTRGRPP